MDNEMNGTGEPGAPVPPMDETTRSLQAAVNLLAILVRDAGGVVRIPKEKFAALENVKLTSTRDPETGDQVLTTRRDSDPDALPTTARGLLLPGRDFLL